MNTDNETPTQSNNLKGFAVTRAYIVSLFAFSIVISIPCLFLMYIGITKPSLNHITFWGSVFLISWGLVFGAWKKSVVVFAISLVLTTPLWLLLLYQTGRRILFIIENGQMEPANGMGSPMAFLLGLVGEQFFFLPLCFVMFFGWGNLIRCFRSNQKRPS